MKPQFWRLWPLQQGRQSTNPASRGLCSGLAWRNFLKTSQPINQIEKQAKKILQRSVWWTNTSETILGLIGEVLTAAVQIGVMTLHFLLSHHITGSLEATVAGVHVVKIFQWFHQIFTPKNLWQDNSHQNKKKELWEVSFCWGLVWFVCLLFPQCSLNLKIRLFSEILRDFFLKGPAVPAWLLPLGESMSSTWEWEEEQVQRNIKYVSFLEKSEPVFFCRGYLSLTQTSENQDYTE